MLKEESIETELEEREEPSEEMERDQEEREVEEQEEDSLKDLMDRMKRDSLLLKKKDRLKEVEVAEVVIGEEKEELIKEIKIKEEEEMENIEVEGKVEEAEVEVKDHKEENQLLSKLLKKLHPLKYSKCERWVSHYYELRLNI